MFANERGVKKWCILFGLHCIFDLRLDQMRLVVEESLGKRNLQQFSSTNKYSQVK